MHRVYYKLGSLEFLKEVEDQFLSGEISLDFGIGVGKIIIVFHKPSQKLNAYFF